MAGEAGIPRPGAEGQQPTVHRPRAARGADQPVRPRLPGDAHQGQPTASVLQRPSRGQRAPDHPRRRDHRRRGRLRAPGADAPDRPGSPTPPRPQRPAQRGRRRRGLLAHRAMRRSPSAGSRCSSRPTAKTPGPTPGWSTGSMTRCARPWPPRRMCALRPTEDHHRARLRPDQTQPRVTQFMRRGRAAVQSEWRLITATHNLLKLHSHWTAAPA